MHDTRVFATTFVAVLGGFLGRQSGFGFGCRFVWLCFFSASASLERLEESILTDHTSLTNIEIMLGAFHHPHYPKEIDLRHIQYIN